MQPDVDCPCKQFERIHACKEASIASRHACIHQLEPIVISRLVLRDNFNFTHCRFPDECAQIALSLNFSIRNKCHNSHSLAVTALMLTASAQHACSNFTYIEESQPRSEVFSSHLSIKAGLQHTSKMKIPYFTIILTLPLAASALPASGFSDSPDSPDSQDSKDAPHSEDAPIQVHLCGRYPCSEYFSNRPCSVRIIEIWKYSD